jgi:RimJ/RimL family protein N-acetyltransferase
MTMLDGPVLETERLILRQPRLEDLDAWAAFTADVGAQRFLGGAQTRHGAWRQLLGVAGSWSLQGLGMFSVIEKASGRWIGRIGPIRHEEWPGTEIGWGLAREAWGRGYATEAAAAAMDFAAEALGWEELIHCIDPANAPSQAVARRLGSVILRQAELPPPFAASPVDVWGQTRTEWRARKQEGRGVAAAPFPQSGRT